VAACSSRWPHPLLRGAGQLGRTADLSPAGRVNLVSLFFLAASRTRFSALCAAKPLPSAPSAADVSCDSKTRIGYVPWTRMQRLLRRWIPLERPYRDP